MKMLSAISSMSLEDYFLLLKVQNEIKKIRQVYLLYRLLHLAIVMAIIFLFSTVETICKTCEEKDRARWVCLPQKICFNN